MPKRILQGRVTSDKNEQTITVLVERRFKHPVLHKIVRSSKKYRAHDALNQFKVGDMGAHSMMRTVSPTLNWLFSSCARYFLDERTVLCSSGCLKRRSTRTVTVCSFLSLVTLP